MGFMGALDQSENGLLILSRSFFLVKRSSPFLPIQAGPGGKREFRGALVLFEVPKGDDSDRIRTVLTDQGAASCIHPDGTVTSQSSTAGGCTNAPSG
ncbi:MAG: hypothetical protein TQ37_05450 [Candidatus Synechococcus spongiarum 15L]|uniref:Uncharacterized protein n=1 Tax=Candidatus Synechococcus spongiarum 15L TaxID=1608419 RepID=A0A0G8AV86_9SYNE|nr:MAG: hypothetical protein TQ37_05450 [Candidatus Synechococcus spongiarum 15L]